TDVDFRRSLRYTDYGEVIQYLCGQYNTGQHAQIIVFHAVK
ncbi:hypothetical protein HMPREF1070_04774, partial [Bacteroides ovatus CL03T12C18]